MSKESSLPLTKTYFTDKGEARVLPYRYRRYPVSRDVAELIGADKDTGHNVPPPSSRRRRGSR